MANHSQQHNTTSPSPLFSVSECIAWLTVYGTQAAAIVTLNALTIIVYLKERSLRKRSMYLVINQAVADMFVGASVIIEYWVLGERCEFWTINFLRDPFYFIVLAILNVSPIASLINLGAISLERTHATFRPFKHRLIKKNIFGAAAAIVWITAGVISTSVVLIRVFLPFTFGQFRISASSYLLSFLFGLLIMVASYSSMAIKIVYGNQPRNHGASSRERKLTKTLFIVTVVSLMLTLPVIIFRISEIVASRAPTSTMISLRTLFRLEFSFVLLFHTNSLVNPVLYTFKMPEFRRALFSFFKCRSQRQSAPAFPLYEI